MSTHYQASGASAKAAELEPGAHVLLGLYHKRVKLENFLPVLHYPLAALKTTKKRKKEK